MLPFLGNSEAIAASLNSQYIASNYPTERAAVNKAKEDAKSAFDHATGSGNANRIEGKAEQVYGKAKQNLGTAKNNIEGAAQQAQGNAKESVGKSQNAVENATHNVQEAADNAVDAVKDFSTSPAQRVCFQLFIVKPFVIN
ncbi:MAG: hypothetical protein HC772_13170 [Leptolyngbyaceae cyanobacterium CRU_2_3]|nr:hypothetical protein [Leptolyngbyaceae cyanobacterium CRU_2_3]